MKNSYIFVIAAFLFSMLLLSNVSAIIPTNQCCMLNNTKCTLWDMGNWSKGQDFCSKLPLVFYNIATNYSTQSCADVLTAIPTCNNGFILCGDGVCNGLESCSSCSSDCGACSSGGGGGSYTGGGAVGPYCGDKICNGQETCSSCSADCGTCPVAKEETPVETILNETTTENNQGAGITGGVIGTLKRPVVFIPILFVLLIAVLFWVFSAKKKK